VGAVVSPGGRIIEFPDGAHAAQRYESPAYQAILPLRTDNSVATVLLIDGVDDDHRATDVLARASAPLAGECPAVSVLLHLSIAGKPRRQRRLPEKLEHLRYMVKLSA
jgi:hypothetical protein